MSTADLKSLYAVGGLLIGLQGVYGTFAAHKAGHAWNAPYCLMQYGCILISCVLITLFFRAKKSVEVSPPSANKPSLPPQKPEIPEDNKVHSFHLLVGNRTVDLSITNIVDADFLKAVDAIIGLLDNSNQEPKPKTYYVQTPKT
jgi:hypothetical protein